jgi:hypothetical protein
MTCRTNVLDGQTVSVSLILDCDVDVVDHDTWLAPSVIIDTARQIEESQIHASNIYYLLLLPWLKLQQKRLLLVRS